MLKMMEKKNNDKGELIDRTAWFTRLIIHRLETKGPVKLIKRVKIAHSFLQSVSNQFHVIILNLPM